MDENIKGVKTITPFQISLKFVAGYEGGWSDHNRDPGGATQFGITRKTLAKWRGHPVTKNDVRSLSIEEAYKIYEAWYWYECQCHKLPLPIAMIVFDCAVNQGSNKAKKILQRVVKVKADGAIGPKTLAAVNRMYNVSPQQFIVKYCARRNVWYAKLTTFSVFGKGWSRRLIDAAVTARTLV